MLSICAYWETSQMEPELEWRMWRQIKGAFGVNRFAFVPILDSMCNRTFDQFATMEEAVANCQGHRVFLEPTGKKSLSEIPQGDIVFILGNTQNHNLKLADPSETYRIAYPSTTDIYGMSAAAIALAYYYGQ